MHRSGTSALARALMLLGGDSPVELLQPSISNVRGFWESPQINAVNNDLFGRRGTNWHSIAPLSDGPAGDGELDAIRAVVAAQFPGACRPVVKDPRLCRLAGTWIDALSGEADRMIFPMIVRNPAEVAASLVARNQFSTILGLLLWTRYNLDAEYLTRGRARGIIFYAALVSDWRAAITGLEAQIGEPLAAPGADGGALDAFLSPDLNRQQVSDEAFERLVSPYSLVRDSWDVMAEWGRKGRLTNAAARRLDALRVDLDRIGVIASDILEQDRVLEKRQLELRRKHDAELTELRAAQAEASSARTLEELEARLHDLLRRSDKQIVTRLEEVREEGRLDRDAVRSDAARHREEADALREQLVGKQEALAALSGENSSLFERLAKLKTQVERMEEDLSAERAGHVEARALVKALRDGFEERQALHAQDSVLRGEQIAALKADRSADRAQLAERQARLDALSTLHRQLEERLRQAEALLEDRARVLRAGDDALAEALSRNRAHEVALDEAASTIAEQQARAKETAQVLVILEEEVSGWKQQVYALESAMEAAAVREGALDDEVRRLSGELAQSAGDVRAAAEEIARITQAHEQVEAARKSVQAELKDVTRKYRSTQATLARTKAALDNARARLAASDAAAAELAGELQRLRGLWHMRVIAAFLSLIDRIMAPLRVRKADPRRADDLVSTSGLFDATWYLDRYADVAQASVAPLSHYMVHGWREGRDPGPDFSVSRYLRENPDVAAAGINPLVHYIEFGQSEGRGARNSKLAVRPASQEQSLAAAAPVYAPSVAEARPAIAASELVQGDPALAQFETLAAALDGDPVTAAVIGRFRNLVAGTDGEPGVAGWPEGRDLAPDCVADAWFSGERSIRLRCARGGAMVVGAFQALGGDGEMRPLAVTATPACEIIDIALQTPFHPLLLIVRTLQGDPVPTLLTFPSLLRGGVHHPEFLNELARAERPSGLTAFDLSGELATSLASLRAGTARAAVSRLAVEVAGATGAGKLFDPVLRRWLRDLFDVPITAVAGDRNRGEAYLAQAVAQDGTDGDGATLVLPADMVPTLALLCAHRDTNDTVGGEVELALSHMVGLHDDSQPGLALLVPPLPLRAPVGAALPHFRGQARLQGNFPLRRHPGPAGISRVRTMRLHDAELLFPVSAALQLTTFEPEGIRLVIDCDGADADSLSRTIEALAMQACAPALEIALLGKVDPLVRTRAQDLFHGRVSDHAQWAAAVAGCQQPFCGVVAAGTVLHDWRTLAVLADVAASGAATASCPLIASTRAGKGWTTRIVANGLVAERPRDAYGDDQIRSSSALWRCTYPVRVPVSGLWLARTDKLKNWTQFDAHRLDHADGEHWCVALTSASSPVDLPALSPRFEPPIADPACFTSVRVFKG